MGNILSMIREKERNNNNNDDNYDSLLSLSIAEEIDKIATHYILTQDAIEMLKLKDNKYYDNLVILIRYINKTSYTKRIIYFISNEKRFCL